MTDINPYAVSTIEDDRPGEIDSIVRRLVQSRPGAEPDRGVH
jgi:hypothetical protein